MNNQKNRTLNKTAPRMRPEHYAKKNNVGGSKDSAQKSKKPNRPFPVSNAKPLQVVETEKEVDFNIIEGRNPVLELLRSDRAVDKLFVSKDAIGAAGKITALARTKKIPVSFCDRRKLDFMSQTGKHQGVIAVAAAHSYAQLSDVLALAHERNEKPLIVICDGLTDPHNVGAIIRSAEVCGAHGVIIPKHRSAGLNSVCAKASAGAIEYIPIVKVTNLSACIQELKKNGIWVVGTAADGEKDIFEADFDIPLALVIGSEGDGMNRLTKESCDFCVRIPVKGKISSLNASAAAAVSLFEVVRSRRK